MQNFGVQLVKEAVDALNEAATVLRMDSDQAFEYVVRNALKVYYIVEQEGYFSLVHSSGKVERMRVTPASSILSEREMKRLASTPAELFSTVVNTQLLDDVGLQAGIYDLTRTDLVNRLVFMGCELAVHLQRGAAFGFTKSGDELGKIEFTQ